VFLEAQTAREIEEKIAERDSDIKKLEEEIAAYQKELTSLSRERDSLASSIKKLDITRKQLNADIKVTENKISRTNLTIESLGTDITNKESSISNNIRSIRLELQKVAEYENKSLIENIFAQDNFTTIWNDIDHIITLREKILDQTTTLRVVKSDLEGTRDAAIESKNELTRLKSQLSDQQKIIIQNANEKNKLLAQTKNNEANYQALLKDRIAKRDAFEKEIEDYEAKLQFILDPSKLPAGRVLSWPLKNIFVTQQFGKTSASGRLYASGTHNGVDFRAATGTPVYAMADGKVLGVGDTDVTCQGASFGKFVFIEYSNGLSSTYGHLSLVKVRSGEEIKRGQTVAYSGNTGHSTGPHLHVSLYASQAVKMTTKASVACDGRNYTLPVAPVNAYLDVLKYLPPL
jgi:murein DD-endopeptidase MepM/ murein hydrolase activator NlpD